MKISSLISCPPGSQITMSRLREALNDYCNRIVWSKTILFIWVLIFSYSLVEYAVVEVLVDYLTDTWKRPSLREAAMIMNLLDGLSAMFAVVLAHMSEAYTGLFSVNVFCTGAYAMGFMLLWVFHWSDYAHLGTMMFAIILIAVGKAGKEPILRGFLDHQLNEKVKKEMSMNIVGDDEDQRISSLSVTEGKRNESRIGLSVPENFVIFAIVYVGGMNWADKFQIAALLMGASHIILYSGFPCYYPEQKPITNNVDIYIYIYMNMMYETMNVSKIHKIVWLSFARKKSIP